MVIKELIMKNFGKFAYKDIELKDGMNIVYGANEAGKSTVHSFIRGMLYGMEKKRGRASKDNLYEKYKPWEGSTIFSGYMKVEDSGKVYEVSRVFNSGDKELQCVDSDTGENCIVDDKPIFVSDISENRYRNTISNEQTKSRVDKDLADELKNYIANLSTSKDKEVDVSKAMKILNDKKRDILKKTTANDIEEVANIVSRDIENEHKLDAVLKESEATRIRLNNETSVKEEESLRIIKEYVDGYEDIKQTYIELVELEDNKQMLDDVEEKVSSTGGMADKTFFMGVAIAALLGILFCFIKFGANAVGIFTSIVVVVVAFFATYFFNDKVTEKLVKRECEKNLRAQQDARENKENINSQILEKQKKILEYAKRVCPLKKVDEEEMLKLEKEISVLKNQIEGHIMQKEQHDQAVKLELEKYNWQIDMLQSDSDARKHRKEQLAELRKVYDSEKKDVDALNIALGAIDELSKSIHFNVSGELNELISKYCDLLTQGKYTKVRVEDQFKISVFGNEKYIDIEKLSVGTIEQIYLAVRLAVAEMFWGDKHLPIILDESFAFYDRDRLKATLKALSQMKKRQIIIFTCHNREANILEDENIEYNYVEL